MLFITSINTMMIVESYWNIHKHWQAKQIQTYKKYILCKINFGKKNVHSVCGWFIVERKRSDRKKSKDIFKFEIIFWWFYHHHLHWNIINFHYWWRILPKAFFLLFFHWLLLLVTIEFCIEILSGNRKKTTTTTRVWK